MDITPALFNPKDRDSFESEKPPAWTQLEPEPQDDLNTNLHDYDPLETK
jgi:hypothetical protein